MVSPSSWVGVAGGGCSTGCRPGASLSIGNRGWNVVSLALGVVSDIDTRVNANESPCTGEDAFARSRRVSQLLSDQLTSGRLVYLTRRLEIRTDYAG